MTKITHVYNLLYSHKAFAGTNHMGQEFAFPLNDIPEDESHVDSVPLEGLEDSSSPPASASHPSDPSTFETLPTNLPEEFCLQQPSPPPAAPAEPATPSPAAEMSMSALDLRIAELTFLGCKDCQFKYNLTT